MNNHVTVLEIDGNALEHNLHYFKNKLHQKTKILAVVKAFGYGSDAAKIASFLKDSTNSTLLPAEVISIFFIYLSP